MLYDCSLGLSNTPDSRKHTLQLHTVVHTRDGQVYLEKDKTILDWCEKNKNCTVQYSPIWTVMVSHGQICKNTSVRLLGDKTHVFDEGKFTVEV